MEDVQLFQPTYDIEECLKHIRECLEIGWTGLGFKTVAFEDAWKQYTGLPHAHFLNSSTAGLDLAIRVYKEEYKWNDGDEVITTPLTFISTNHAILYSNLKAVFADIDETLCLDPKSIAKLITPRTKAVMYVGMGSNPGRYEEVVELCRNHKLKLILDAAHMSGTYLNGRHIGPGADCTIFSFQAVKNLPTGDSGMICFDSADLDAKVRKWSWLGINKDTYLRSMAAGASNYKWLYDVEYVGTKAHGNSIMASIGLAQLKHLDRDNARRREICSYYQKELEAVPGLAFIPYRQDCNPGRHLFQIRVPAKLRDELIVSMNKNHVHPGVHYLVNTDYRMYRYAKGTCPKADAASRELVSLPLHLRLNDASLGRVVQSVRSFLASNLG